MRCCYLSDLLNLAGSLLLLSVAGCTPATPVMHLEPEVSRSIVAPEPMPTHQKAAVDLPERNQGTTPAVKQEEPFVLPGDVGGQLLDKTLRPNPSERALRAADPVRPPAPPLMGFPEPATALLNAQSVAVPRFPVPPGKGMVRPEPLFEESLDVGLTPRVPLAPYFPTGRPTRIETQDLSLPPPLPQLAGPVPDPIPTEDVTADASTANVLQAVMPVRTTAVPFLRQGVPEPFENRDTLPPASLPEEPSMPQAYPPRGPGK